MNGMSNPHPEAPRVSLVRADRANVPCRSGVGFY
jgi:hypothetical protein